MLIFCNFCCFDVYSRQANRQACPYIDIVNKANTINKLTGF